MDQLFAVAMGVGSLAWLVLGTIWFQRRQVKIANARARRARMRSYEAQRRQVLS